MEDSTNLWVLMVVNKVLRWSKERGRERERLKGRSRTKPHKRGLTSL
jgi:hypothetical protein